MIDRTPLHFEITAKMGGSGMGEVHRAEDTKLGRARRLKPPAAWVVVSRARISDSLPSLSLVRRASEAQHRGL
jgi:hypothetical protein